MVPCPRAPSPPRLTDEALAGCGCGRLCQELVVFETGLEAPPAVTVRSALKLG
jgi:hypothetical protein